MFEIVFMKPHKTIKTEDPYRVLMENNIPEPIARDCQQWAETAEEYDTYNEEDFDVYA